MIISHKYKFIFLKTVKTAGTSVEIALSKFCEQGDIITPITPKDEDIRRQLGFRGPQNYLIPFHKYTLRDWMIFLLNRKRRRFFNHSPAKMVASYIEEEIWNDYYKFCFERNPWDRVLSLYYWQYPAEPRPSLSEFIDSDEPYILKKGGYWIYTINDEIVVDRVCFYENLEDELRYVCNEQLGIMEDITLPRAKVGFRTDARHYRDIYCNEDKEKIARMFAQEIALFGW